MYLIQETRLPYVCAATSLWGGGADPPPGVRFHPVREHLPWAAAQKGQDNILDSFQKTLFGFIMLKLYNVFINASLCNIQKLSGKKWEALSGLKWFKRGEHNMNNFNFMAVTVFSFSVLN